MTDHVFTIDPHGSNADHLGPANAEQRAEIRESWRTWFWNGAHWTGVIVGVVLAGVVVFGLGLMLGAFNPEIVLEVVR